MDLIMREALIDEFEYYIEEAGWGDEWNRVIEEVALESVRNAPTIDAVPVVRCKDCKYYKRMKKNNRAWCYYTGFDYEEDFFCADGKRMDGDAE